MQHSLVCLWSAACYNRNPFFNNNERQSLCMYLSSLQAATSRENRSSGLLLQPPPQLAARHAIFWTLENRPTKKSIRFKRHFSTRKKTLQKSYCRLISKSNIKNARSIDLPAENPPASDRGRVHRKQSRGAAVRERERASVREVGRASNDRAAQDIPGCNAAMENSNNSGRLFFGPQFWTPITWPFFWRKKITSSPPKKY